MRRSKALSRLRAGSCLLALTIVFSATLALGQHETFLHGFGATGPDGYQPLGGLVFDSSGNLYGTTSSGGTKDFGTVFEISPRSGGGWSERVLHNFGIGLDGIFPYAGLTIDASGNLYGTTTVGGVFNLGTVFRLSPQPGGGWTETILYSFHESNDGYYPYAGLTLDSAGNLYGTTENGGSDTRGTVFELSPTASGPWKETILLNFDYSDGANPRSGVVFDSAGNLYGATEFGGVYGYGAVYELSPSSGGWTPTVLYSFNNNSAIDPLYPVGGLTLDAAGNVYGTGIDGAAYGGGAVFELSPSVGAWNETIVHAFNFAGADGFSPQAGLTFDSNGNLYGTTAYGGNGDCTSGGNFVGCGIVFKLSNSGGTWSETILHNFKTGRDGERPTSNLIFDSSGNLFGTTSVGGPYGDGIAFELTP